MTALPTPPSATAAAIVAWRERTADTEHRPHLGASIIGYECDRRLWLTFRWAGREHFDGRMLRLFDSGKREESRVYAELRGIGCEVWADDGDAQYRVAALGGHFGGSMDGVVQGLPEAPKTPHVLEIKTHNAKSFKTLQARGVRLAKPAHYAQMQAYMGLVGLDRALYYAVNKDTDEIYTERVPLDPAEFAKVLARAEKIITATEPPLRLSEDPDWFECKFCPFHAQCHGTRVPEVNCRTCAHSTPVIEGGGIAVWKCGIASPEHGLDVLSVPAQRTGCDAHLFIPPLLEKLGAPVDGGVSHVVYETKSGATFVNGPPPGFSSAEIAATGDPRALTDPTVQAVKAAVPTATVTA